jgi:CelD/BcsL family acetyltransferase involved in cellulose biosynthesis
LANELVPRGDVVLTRICHGGEPQAVIYGHRVGSKFHCYQTGVNHDTQVSRSAGTMAFLATASHLAQQGVLIYNHLLGENEFKRNYAKSECNVMSLEASKPTFRFFGAHTEALGRRCAQKVSHLFRAKDRRRLAGQAKGND